MIATLASALLFAVTCVLWLRSHIVRDYAWAFLPWPGDAAGQRRLKLDADSGGGQLDVSWKVWTAADREQLRLRALRPNHQTGLPSRAVQSHRAPVPPHPVQRRNGVVPPALRRDGGPLATV